MANSGLIGIVLRFYSVEEARARLVLAMSLQQALAESALENTDMPMYVVLAEQLVAEIARLRWITAQFEALLPASAEANYHEFDELVKRLNAEGRN